MENDKIVRQPVAGWQLQSFWKLWAPPRIKHSQCLHGIGSDHYVGCQPHHDKPVRTSFKQMCSCCGFPSQSWKALASSLLVQGYPRYLMSRIQNCKISSFGQCVHFFPVFQHPKTHLTLGTASSSDTIEQPEHTCCVGSFESVPKVSFIANEKMSSAHFFLPHLSGG